VALLDILGFRKLIARTPLQGLAERNERVIANAEATLQHPLMDLGKEPTLFPGSNQTPLCQLHVFSDTVVLISHDDTDESCAKLLVYGWRVAQGLTAMGFPVRGAVSFGEMHSNPARHVFLGRALTEAYELEQAQDWAGIALSPSLDAKIGAISRHPVFSRITDLIICEYDVPMKTGVRQRLQTLNWRFNLVVKKGTRSLFPDDGDPAVGTKVRNTLEYARAMRGRAYTDSERSVPIEMRTFFVGDGPPPPNFAHGDDL
jgi:hypothetical protein